MRSSAGHRACVRTATAPAISFQTSCQVPMRRALMRRESQIIGLAPHQGNLVITYLKLSSLTKTIEHDIDNLSTLTTPISFMALIF